MVTRSPAVSRLSTALGVLAFAMPAAAQIVDDNAISAPAHIAFIEGDASLARDGREEPALTNVPLLSGDRLRTSQGRAEVIYGDGSVLDIDQFTEVDFLSDELLRLTEGRVRLDVGGRDRVSYRIDTPSGAVRIEVPGEYRVSLIGAQGAPGVELVATSGVATLVNQFGETEVRAGERAVATASLAPSYAQPFNSARWDAFDTWANERREARLGTASARYLPDDIHGYAGDFDRYGDWRYEHEYGYVWYPRVHVSWRPYYHGRWNWFGPWGWTWISYDRWGWPTHHYGRWGYRAGSWFWVPKRRWAPAWVYWASAPGYVGWCPLGWDNRPIFSIININVNVRRGYDPYHFWTVVPRHGFGTRDVTRYAVPRGTLRTAVPRWGAETATAPIRPAVQRTATPIYSAGRSYARSRPAGVETQPRVQRSFGSDVSTRAPGAAPSAGARTAVPRSRAVAPATAGVLPQSAEPGRGSARARSRYRDAGPGGATATAPLPGDVDRRRDTLTRERAVPRRVPQRIDSPPSTPRDPGGSRAGERELPRYAPPSRESRVPSRRSSPGAGSSGAKGSDRPGMARPRSQPSAPSSPPARMGGPSRGSSDAPRRVAPRSSEGSRGAAPRSPDRVRTPSRSAPSGGAGASSRSDDAPRARPRPRPQ